MEETQSLTGFRRKSISVYIWWGLNIAIAIFVFLAFLMSTLSYAHSKDFANQVNNSFITQQGGLISQTYKVSTGFTTAKGSVVSFCGHDNLEICEGLGPVWHRPFTTNSASPAIQASLHQISPNVAIYAHVVDSNHMQLRVSLINTSPSSSPSVWDTQVLSLDSPITSVHARATSDANVFGIMYTIHNTTYLLGGVVTTTATSGSTKLGNPIDLFDIHDPNQNDTLTRNLVSAGDWLLVSYAYSSSQINYRAYTPNKNDGNGNYLTPKPLNAGTFKLAVVDDVIASVYLGNGNFMQATADSLVLGKIDFVNSKIDFVAAASFYVTFNTLQLTPLNNGVVLFSGSQVMFVDVPLAMTMLVQWAQVAPFLTVNYPTNLLAGQGHMLLMDQLSACYLPPNTQEPYGAIFFTYVDARSRFAKIIRSRPFWNGNTVHLLPSPALSISTHQYARYGSFLAPHISCPTGVSPEHVLLVLQDYRAIFNTYTWAGGYNYAGIAQAANAEGKDTVVVRQGISSGHDSLVPGFQYYLWNNGTIAPYASTQETFSPNGFPFPIGTAISDKLLHLENEVFDFAMW